MTKPYIQYGLEQYGLYQYGRYELDADGDYKPELEPRMRIRTRTDKGKIGLWVETQQLQQNIPGHFPFVRMRTNNGNWVYTQNVSLPAHMSKVRIRATNEKKEYPWVLYEEAVIKKEG